MALLYYFDHQGILLWGIFACILHEGGHYVAIRSCGGEVSSLSLTLVGAEMSLQGDLSYGQEIWVALSGPLLNLVTAWLTCGRYPLFAGLNLALGLVNLLPVGPLDGGRILWAVMGLLCPYHWTILSGCDILFSGVLLVLGVLLFLEGGSITLFLLALWLIQRL